MKEIKKEKSDSKREVGDLNPPGSAIDSSHNRTVVGDNSCLISFRPSRVSNVTESASSGL